VNIYESEPISPGAAARVSFSGFLVLSIVVCVVTLSAVTMSTRDQKSVRDGVYTEAQAKRGATLFNEACASCHGTDEFGSSYIEEWTGQPALRLFDLVRLSMPEESPGSLKRQEYADILAYLFKLNGFKAGNEELKGTDEALKAVRIE
jgi:S-disulfanyl-L-cysteine oxidoreductase SoxD